MLNNGKKTIEELKRDQKDKILDRKSMDKVVGLIRSMVSDTDTELKYFRENIPYAFSGKVSKSGLEVGNCLKF